MKSKLFTVAAAIGLALATSANAKPKSPPPPPPPPPPPIVLPTCANSDVQFGSVFATDCAGFYDKNTIQGAVDSEDISALSSLTPALANLLDGQAFLAKLDTLGGQTDLTFSGLSFYGLTYFGLHVGGGGPYPGVNSSAYYVVDYGAGGGNTLKLNLSASSNIAVYKTGSAPISPPPPPPPIMPMNAVPEPATWMTMILGFGAVGALIRRRRAERLAL